ncbi:MAG: hypothetical protein WCP01_00385 [Methylococcaceae bacterium]
MTKLARAKDFYHEDTKSTKKSRGFSLASLKLKRGEACKGKNCSPRKHEEHEEKQEFFIGKFKVEAW